MNSKRLRKLQKQLKHPLLVKKKENLYYLTGQSFDLRAEEYLLVKKNGVVGFGSGLEKIDWVKKSDRLKNIAKYLTKGSELDIEYGFTYGEGEYIRFKAKSFKVKVKPSRSAVDEARTLKEPSEIAFVKKSMQIVERVFTVVKKSLKQKQWTESGLAHFIMETGKSFGAEDISFPAIVASGENAAIPHHVPSDKKLKKGESIIIDFGFKYKQYCSDFTRTVFLGFAPQKLAAVYNQTELAYQRSIEAAKPGVSAGSLYDLSVKALEEKKLAKYFIHSLGHGTGLEIHELPNLSPKSKDVLANGMVFSIEPGVYFPKQGGIRIEDLVYLEKGVCNKFIQVSTKLENNIIK